jgi:hypothetical protein
MILHSNGCSQNTHLHQQRDFQHGNRGFERKQEHWFFRVLTELGEFGEAGYDFPGFEFEPLIGLFWRGGREGRRG